MNAVKLPIVLTDDLKRDKPVQADALSITISARDKSTAVLTLPVNAATYPMHTFFELFTSKGSAGVFWQTNASLLDNTGRTYSLTHAIDTLRKNTYKEQTTFEGTRQGFLSKLFSYQNPVFWQIGDIYAPENAYKSANINYTNLSDLFTRFLQDNVDLYPVYDFSTTPWTVHIRKLPEEIGARFSLTRNAETCRIVYDDKQQATRLYLAVNTPEKVNGITKYTAELKTYEDADAIAEYGVFEKTASIKTDEITGTPDDWAREFFEKYKDPTVQITVDGYELWKQTGEIYDEMSVGKRCKVALPEFGATTIQRIESVTYPDALKAPTAITVSLATKQKTFTTAISNLEKEVEKVGGVAGGAALSSAKAEEVYAWSLIMQKVEEAVNGTGIVNLWETGIIIDTETGATIYSLEQGFVSAFAAIKVNADKILLKANKSDVDDLAERVSYAEIDIDGANAAIRLKAEQSVVDDLAERVSSAEIDIDGVNSEISLKANKTYVDNLFAESVTTTNLAAEIAKIEKLSLQRVSGTIAEFSTVTADNVSFGGNQMYRRALSMGDVVSTDVLTSKGSAIDLAHSHAVYVSDDGTVTLGKVSATGGNFNLADTKFYQEGVSAAVDGVTLSASGWIDGHNTVSASNGKTKTITLPDFSVSGGTSFNSSHKTTVYFSTPSVDQPLKTVTVDASGVYNDGYAAGWAAAKARFRMEWPDQGSYDYLLNIYQPGDTPDSADVMDELQIGATYSLNEITNTAPNTFYTSGWAYARTRLNGGSWTNRHRVNMTQTTTINVGQG